MGEYTGYGEHSEEELATLNSRVRLVQERKIELEGGALAHFEDELRIITGWLYAFADVGLDGED